MNINDAINALPLTRWQRFASKWFVRVVVPARNFIRKDPVMNALKPKGKRVEIVHTDWSTEPEPSIQRDCHLCGEKVWIPLDLWPSAVYGPWPEHKSCSDRVYGADASSMRRWL